MRLIFSSFEHLCTCGYRGVLVFLLAMTITLFLFEGEQVFDVTIENNNGQMFEMN
jgi:hypothetical protein